MTIGSSSCAKLAYLTVCRQAWPAENELGDRLSAIRFELVRLMVCGIGSGWRGDGRVSEIFRGFCGGQEMGGGPGFVPAGAELHSGIEPL